MEKRFEYHLSLNDRLEQLVNNEYTADVFFKVGDSKELMFAHRNIITISSDVFYAQFNGQFDDAKTNRRENPIVLEDIQPEVFLQILRFMYCEKVDLDCDILLEVYYAAKKYMLIKLGEICEEFIRTAEDGVLKVFNDNRRYEFENINRICLYVIRDNPLKCFGNSFFTYLNKKTLEMIIKSAKINCHENHLKEATQRWMKFNKSEETSEIKINKSVRDVHCKKLYAFSSFQYSSALNVTDITVNAIDTFNLYGFGIFIGAEPTNTTSVKLNVKIEHIGGTTKTNCISETKIMPLKEELYVHEMLFERITLEKGSYYRIDVRIEANEQPMPSMFYLNNFQPACSNWKNLMMLTYTTSVCKNCLAYLLYNDNKSTLNMLREK